MSFLIPKKPQILYAPMLASFGGGSARGFNPGGGGATMEPFTFTNAAKEGKDGPTLANCRSAYASTAIDWDVNDTTQFNVTTLGYQDFRIFASGTYRLRVRAARGGNSRNTSTGVRNGGQGVEVDIDYTFSEGDAIRVIVGQAGVNDTTEARSGSGGGGGGTFVLYGTSMTSLLKTESYITANLLVAAGGGGGATDTSFSALAGTGMDGSPTSTSGTSSRGGTNNFGTQGTGGSNVGGAWSGGSGAGAYTEGSRPLNSGAFNGTKPLTYDTDFTGGVRSTNYGQNGGFGGGAGGSWGGSGGGGFSGGSGDLSNGAGNDKDAGGGGGTEYRTTHSGSLNSRGNHSDDNGSVLIEMR